MFNSKIQTTYGGDVKVLQLTLLISLFFYTVSCNPIDTSGTEKSTEASSQPTDNTTSTGTPKSEPSTTKININPDKLPETKKELFNLAIERMKSIRMDMITGKTKKIMQMSADKGHEGAKYSIEIIKNSETDVFHKPKLHIGKMFYDGEIVSKNYSTAFHLFKISSEGIKTGIPNFYVGKMYYEGTGVEKNYDIAIEHLSKSVKSLSISKEQEQTKEAVLYLANAYYLGNNDERFLKKTVDTLLYFYGFNNIDEDEKNLFFEKICNKATIEKLYGKNIEELTELEMEDISTGQYEIARTLRLKNNVGLKLKKLSPDDLERIKANLERLVNQCLNTAIKFGSANAMYDIGRRKHKEKDVAKPNLEAVTLITKAAEKNHAWAQYYLAGMYSNGDSVKKDMAKATYWYKESAENGQKHAQYIMGKSYYKGIRVEQDYKKAVELLTKSAKQKVTGAAILLGSIYYSGIGIKKDLVQSYAWGSYACSKIYKHKLNQPQIDRCNAFVSKAEKSMSKSQLKKATKLSEEYQKKYKY